MLLLQRLHLIALICTLLQTLTKSAQYCPLKLYLRLIFKCSYASWVSPFAIFCLDLQIGTNFGNGTLKIFLTSVKNVLPPFIDTFQTGSVSQVCKSGHTVILKEHWQGCYYKNSFLFYYARHCYKQTIFFLFPCLKKLTATPVQSNLGTQGEKNDDSRNVYIEKCRKIIKLNSARCMSECQVKASYATIVTKCSSLEYPLKSWSSTNLRSPHDRDSALQVLKQLFPLPRLAFLLPPLHQLHRLYSWGRSGLCRVGRENRRRGDANNPTPVSSTNGFGWPWSQISKHGDGSLHTCLFSF